MSYRHKKLLVVFGIIFAMVSIVFLLSRGHVYEKNELEYGLTFSQKQAENLGLDWRGLYLQIFNDLGVKKIRIPAYWDEIEREKGVFVWEDLDWQVEQAELHGAEIILSMGIRLPRWPECHLPDWASDMSKEERESAVLDYIYAVITRYQDRRQIVAWQIENEPFLRYFGECPEFDKRFLDKEIELAHSVDERPIVVTDSGELSVWVPAAKRADIFGTTMYRDTYSQHLQRYIHYPITPGFFRLKKNIASWFAEPQKWIVIELQAEPWGPRPYSELTKAEKDRTMNLRKFREMMEFSSQTGFKEFYLWGLEWWAWERDINKNPVLWEEAKKLFQGEYYGGK